MLRGWLDWHQTAQVCRGRLCNHASCAGWREPSAQQRMCRRKASRSAPPRWRGAGQASYTCQVTPVSVTVAVRSRWWTRV